MNIKQEEQLAVAIDHLREDLKDMRADHREDAKAIREEMRVGFSDMNAKIEKHTAILATHTAEDHRNFESINVDLARIETNTTATDKAKSGVWSVVMFILKTAIAAIAVIIAVLALK